MKVLLVTTLLVVSVLLSHSAVIDNPSEVNQELFIYEEQIRIMYQLLVEKCPEVIRSKRDDFNNQLLSSELMVQKLHYTAFLKKLNDCMKSKQMQTTSVKSTSTSSTITNLPTTTELETTTQPMPAPCLSATNLTDSWRIDHDGTDLRGGGPNAQYGRACDFRKSIQWFRFTGAAGKNITYRLKALNNRYKMCCFGSKTGFKNV